MAHANSALPPQAGEIIDGRYRIESTIGVGGMAMVMAATHLHLGTRVAIKFMLSQMTRCRGVDRSMREARSIASLRNEHVVRVLDVGMRGTDAPYLVMELLQGSDLKVAMAERTQPLPISHAVGYVLQACEGMAEAHAFGIVHRDLKLRNLILTTRVDGSPLIKVVDFGISKQMVLEGQEELTMAADIVGSPLHMAPEMISGGNVDARTDIWGFGIVLYELLTGVLPFRGDDVRRAIVHDVPAAPTLLRPDVPASLSAVVMRCLQKDPAARFGNVVALAAALEPFCPRADAGSAARMAKVMRLRGSDEDESCTTLRPYVATWEESPSTPTKPREWRRVIALAGGAMILSTALSTLVLEALPRKSPMTIHAHAMPEPLPEPESETAAGAAAPVVRPTAMAPATGTAQLINRPKTPAPAAHVTPFSPRRAPRAEQEESLLERRR